MRRRCSRRVPGAARRRRSSSRLADRHHAPRRPQVVSGRNCPAAMPELGGGVAALVSGAILRSVGINSSRDWSLALPGFHIPACGHEERPTARAPPNPAGPALDRAPIASGGCPQPRLSTPQARDPGLLLELAEGASIHEEGAVLLVALDDVLGEPHLEEMH